MSILKYSVFILVCHNLLWNDAVMDAQEAAKNALSCVLEAEKGESLVIFCDDEKIDIGEAFVAGALDLGLQTRLTPLKTDPRDFRKEIPKQVTEILKQPPDIYVNVFRGAREEAPFRIELIKLETKEHRARLGHCPGVTMDMLTEGALALTAEGHREMQAFARKLMQKLDRAVKIEITNPVGTNISLGVEGRCFFTDTIIDRKTMKWMNLPTGEVLVAPVEDSAEGELICDLAIGGIGPIETPVKLTVRNGKVQDSSSKSPQILRNVRDSLKTDGRSSIIGEFAFGINLKARFVDEFLEAEKLFGTIHIAFGDNSDFPGGKNPSRNHLDLLVSKPSVKAFTRDGLSFDVLVDGTFSYV
jgi:leucyl aminopeptidase (aminopeptidase T)